MDIYLQVSDDKKRTLTLDGDLDLLDRLLATIQAGREEPQAKRKGTPTPATSTTPPRQAAQQ